MKVVFYDISLLNLKNYVGDIIQELNENPEVDVELLYDEYSQEADVFFGNLMIRPIRNKSYSYKLWLKYVNKSQPDLVVVNAQRLSDSAFVSVAKKNGIKTLMIQHGMYIPFMKREKFYLIKKAVKTFKYFLYSQVVAKSLGSSGLAVFWSFFSAFVLGKRYKESIPFFSSVNVDHVFVYGDYWKTYHFENFGYNIGQQITIGYHELSKVEEIKRLPMKKNTFCYIAQTLVEDGRLSRAEMEAFLDRLEVWACKIGANVIVKLHPRSDMTLYSQRDFELERTLLPNCLGYIGHYSSLLAVSADISNVVLLFEFTGHPIPDYFTQVGADFVSVESFLTIDEVVEYSCFEGDIRWFFEGGYSTEKASSALLELFH